MLVKRKIYNLIRDTDMSSVRDVDRLSERLLEYDEFFDKDDWCLGLLSRQLLSSNIREISLRNSGLVLKVYVIQFERYMYRYEIDERNGGGIY